MLGGKSVIPRARFSRLAPEHVAYLTAEATLVQQAGLTVAERCAVFKQRYPPARLSPTQLRRLYHAHGIRRKTVRKLKALSVDEAGRYQQMKT